MGRVGGRRWPLLDLMSSAVAFRIVPSNLSLTDVLVILVGLVVLWIIISIPVYLAGKVVTAGKSSFGDAMVASLFGPVVFLIVLIVVDFFLGEVIGSGAFIWAYILAFIAWLWVYKVSFWYWVVGGFGFGDISCHCVLCYECGLACHIWDHCARSVLS